MSKPSQVEALFLATLAKENPDERVAFLDAACAGDVELRRQVEKLLAAHARVEELRSQQAPAPAAPEATEDLSRAADVMAETLSRPHRFPLEHTRAESRDDEDSRLDFLQPATRPDALGRLGHYDVLELLGKGGFGVVFRAFDEKLQRVVAIKVLSPPLAVTSPARKRFLREARSSAQVRHEHVVQIYSVEEEPLPYLVMEFIPGETLQQRLDRTGPLDTTAVVQLGRQIAEGLAAAHSRGLIHRDIKPSNILIDASASLSIKITDFGLARAADDASLSQSGTITGTPMYMAPEQAQGEALDHRADLFSLGSVLYTMCAGQPPFRASSTLAVLKRVAEETPRPIPEIMPAVPLWLCDLIARLHAKKPADRIATAREVADLLARGLSAAPPARLADQSPGAERGQQRNEVETASLHAAPAPTASRKRRWAVAAGLLLLVAGLGVTEATGVTAVRGAVLRLFAPDERQMGRSTEEPPSDTKVSRASSKEPEPTTAPTRKTPPPVADPDRRAAEYVLSLGGKVSVNDEDREIGADAGLPRAPFRLTFVSLCEKKVSDAGWAHFQGCKHLTGIDLYSTPVSDEGLAHFKDSQNLTALYLAQASVNDVCLAHFKHCKKLTTLNLHNNASVSDVGLAHFKDCKGLQTLILALTQVSDAGLAHFKSCTDLRELRLQHTQVSDVGLAHFKNCQSLTVLFLGETPVTDTGLAHFKDCKKLTELALWGTQVTDEGFAYFKDCKELRELWLWDTQLGDKSTAHLENFRSLAVLRLKNTKISDASLAHLKRCENLRELELAGTAVSDVGLPHLRSCKNLVQLTLHKSKVTNAGIKELKKALPKCKIEWDGGVIEPTGALPAPGATSSTAATKGTGMFIPLTRRWQSYAAA